MKRKIAVIFACVVFAVCLSFSFSVNAAEIESNTDKQTTVYSKNQSEKRHINDGTAIELEYTVGYYTGSAFCPKVTVSCDGKHLEEDRDFILAYRNNTEVGRANIEITGIGDYFGKTNRNFTIAPDAVRNLKQIDSTLSQVKISWDKNDKADGYAVYRFENGKYVLKTTITNINTVQYACNQPSCSVYQYAVCAYKDINGSRFYGELSEPLSAYTLVDKYNSGVLLRRNDNSPSAQVLIHSVAGASGYQVMYSPDPDFKSYIGTVTTKNITFNINGYYRDLPMYARVRIYLDTPDGRIYGAWSSSVNDFRYNGRVWTDKPANSSSMRVWFDKSVYGSGYEISYSYNRNFKSEVYKHISYGINDLDEVISNLRRDKTYFVTVRPFYKLGNTFYYGPYGDISVPEFTYVFATYSSKYVNNADRTTNLRIASEAINGTVIMPGETFDFNVIVGPRTAERGYKKATVFTGANGTAQELGGGICQVASTIFNTCLYADVDIRERHQHSQKVSYVPLGRDAAISGEYKNFRWTNNYDFPIKIYMEVSGGYITCTFYTQNQEDPGDIELKVTKKGNTYTLNRYHNGKVDYTCTSRF